MSIRRTIILLLLFSLFSGMLAFWTTNGVIRSWRRQHQQSRATETLRETTYALHHLSHQCAWDALGTLTAAPVVRRFLAQGRGDDAASHLLEQARQFATAEIGYLITPNGEVVLSTEWDDPAGGGRRSLLGYSYPFRDYVKAALQGQHFLTSAIGITTKQRGMYFSAPVAHPDTGAVCGVAVLKIGMAAIESSLAGRHQRYLLVAPDRVVIATNVPDALFRTVRPLASPEIHRLRTNRQYDGATFEPLPFDPTAERAMLEGRPFLLTSTPVFDRTWTLFVMEAVVADFPLSEAHLSVIWVTGAVAIGLVIILFLLILLNHKRRRAEELAQHNRTRFDTLVRHVPGAVYRASWAEGRGLEYVSDHILPLSGYRPAELTAQGAPSLESLIPGEERARVHGILASAAARGGVYSLSYPILHRDGDQRQILDQGQVIPAPGEPLFEGIIVDISTQHRLQEELRHSQKMDSIGQLAGGIAHDFNNMLGGIIGAAELLLRGLSPEDIDRRSILDMILRTARQAAGLTNKLLSFSRKGKLVSTPLDLHQLVRDTVDILESTIGPAIVIETALQASRATVTGDPSQLQNMLLNLALNARDAMPNGGKLAIHTRNRKLDAWECQMSAFDIEPGDYIELSVADTGTGIAPEHLPKIFEPFFTTKPVGEGTGLGLSAVYGTIRDHRGTITLSSTPSLGTVFTLDLPTCRETAVIQPRPATEPVHGTGIILLIDDDQFLRQTAGQILTELGYEVITAQDGCVGVELFRKHQDRIAAVLLDLVMPRMCGEECFALIRRIRPEAKVIITSGFSAHAGTQRLLEDGACAFLKKPYGMHQLSVAVHDAIHGPPHPTP